MWRICKIDSKFVFDVVRRLEVGSCSIDSLMFFLKSVPHLLWSFTFHVPSVRIWFCYQYDVFTTVISQGLLSMLEESVRSMINLLENGRFWICLGSFCLPLDKSLFWKSLLSSLWHPNWWVICTIVIEDEWLIKEVWDIGDWTMVNSRVTG